MSAREARARSRPPCGGGLGWGVAPCRSRWLRSPPIAHAFRLRIRRVHCPVRATPTPARPHKGGGSERCVRRRFRPISRSSLTPVRQIARPAIAAGESPNYCPPAFHRAGSGPSIGASPSGKAADFDSAIPRFESWRPSQDINDLRSAARCDVHCWFGLPWATTRSPGGQDRQDAASAAVVATPGGRLILPPAKKRPPKMGAVSRCRLDGDV